ncbi:phage protein [Streptococcus pneumoniae]|uniref:HIRAN domain-containing protein n=1 Tax=Streptococcus pneumoniae TaxID=1313 RepID=UPI00090C377B|nr:HIRAN domain-containing protein [Streptococcus pneumoniae]APJ29370.1 phage protein [Streptococcus pneumoniae]MCX4111615.1 HIRAN domain-containing protein [Streptococcus pneumoniae]VKF57655.1 phage protein [Streptococcus pneumoniae]VOB59201.1 phage protein [Streptococcus pneumoniae]VQE81484.1 phage protein [Streptococcus pneumoniae]
MQKTVEKILFRVAGVTKYKKAVKEACNMIAEDNGIPEYAKYYSNLSTKELREELEEYGLKVFKYQDLDFFNIELVPEVDNRYDPNAIKVLIFDNHVGYVPATIAKTIRKYFDNKKYNFVIEGEIKGGPYKEWDEYEEKVVTNNDLDVGFEIYLTIVDSSQKEVIQSESSEIIDDNISNKEVTETEAIETEAIETKTTETEHIEQNIVSDSVADIVNEINLSETSPKKKLPANKIIFSALYLFLVFFGVVGIPIAPFLAVPLTAWSLYKLYKLFRK